MVLNVKLSYKSIDKRHWIFKLLEKRNINANTGCWEWTGSTYPDGYGLIYCNINKMKSGRKTWRVHRISAYWYLNMNIYSSLCVCHHCDNPICYNPLHLFIGTHSDNMRDASKKGRMKGTTRRGPYKRKRNTENELPCILYRPFKQKLSK